MFFLLPSEQFRDLFQVVKYSDLGSVPRKNRHTCILLIFWKSVRQVHCTYSRYTFVTMSPQVLNWQMKALTRRILKSVCMHC